MSPEEKARLKIDENLKLAGWVIQDMKEINLKAGLGVVVREYPTDGGEVDYALFVNGVPCGVIEAKKSEAGENLIVAEGQNKGYANSKMKYIKYDTDIRFAYECTDKLIRFTDYEDIDYASREVFNFFRPETLQKLLERPDTVRNYLKNKHEFDINGFRTCQINAINNLDKSLAENRKKALVQMATGSGKTYTAITGAYRMLKFGHMNRILFLVDTKSLGEQTEQEFRAYKPNDDPNRSFCEIYGVHRLQHSSMPKDCQVYISTIQRMYSMLRGENPTDDIDEQNCSFEKKVREVVYNKNYPPEFFDCIIVDECHRSIYNVWSQVLEYFDAFIVGLTATPDNRTLAFFNQNLVSEYTREQAIIDGVNVGEDIFIIETEIGKEGGKIEAKQLIERRNRQTRAKRFELLDEDIDYAPNELDKAVVNKDQIRTVIKCFREALSTRLFPCRKEVPKTLVFAKTDSHASDIVEIIREEFGKGNEFCSKITYAEKYANTTLKSFRNDYNPRIAVTVDMIATGTDVKPIECLLFMRDVRSKNYFEQMKGRGTRTLDVDELRKVSPSATENKDHFVIVDAVGVTKSKKVETRTLERKPSVPMKDLLISVAVGDKDEDTLTTLAGRLTRLNAQMTKDEAKAFKAETGTTLGVLASDLLNAFDQDFICDKADIKIDGARELNEAEQKAFDTKQKELIEKAVNPFNDAELRKKLVHLRAVHDQIVDNINLDKVIYADFDKTQKEDYEKLIGKFHQYIEDNQDEIIAMNIVYDVKYKDRHMTIVALKELYGKLQQQGITVGRLWDAYGSKYPEKVKRGTLAQLTDLISMIRFEMGLEDNLQPFANKVNYNYMKWSMDYNRQHDGKVLTEEQAEWLRLIRDYIAKSLSITKDDFEMNPFVQKGGLGKFYELFGDEYEEILQSLNWALVA